jgi:hypothetical protein
MGHGLRFVHLLVLLFILGVEHWIFVVAVVLPTVDEVKLYRLQQLPHFGVQLFARQLEYLLVVQFDQLIKVLEGAVLGQTR